MSTVTVTVHNINTIKVTQTMQHKYSESLSIKCESKLKEDLEFTLFAESEQAIKQLRAIKKAIEECE